MYGDTAVIRARVADLREQGVDVRAMADRLVAQSETLEWEGRAATDLRQRMRDRAEQLRGCARRHDDAADALDRHLHEVARLHEAIADRQRRGTALIDAARDRAAEVASHHDADAASGVVREASDDDRRVLAISPPPSGHRDWLTVEIPGLA